MNTRTGMIAVIALSLCVVACSTIVDRIAGGQDMKRVNELWTDVPKMDGLNASDLEMPAATKLILRTILGNLGRLNKEGEPQQTGSIDWLAYTTTKTPDEVSAFYTNDKMAAFGNWDTSKESTCISGKDKGVGGVFCVFQKKMNGRQAGLVIVAAEDEKTKQTNLFFVRIEGDEAPANKK